MKPAGTSQPVRPAKGSGPVPARIAVRSAIALAAILSASPALAGVVSGHVHFDGPVPPRPTIHMSADPACDKIAPEGRPSDVLVVDPSGGLANVIVYVKSGLPEKSRWDLLTPSARIDQKGCVYIPHVLAVQTGQDIEIHSADDTFHNVNARTSVNAPFNVATPGNDVAVHRSFSKAEVAVKLKCDIHPWMSAYVGVFDHPFFAVSASDGRFALPNLPEGKYTLEAWHESLGTGSAKIEVDDDKPVSVDFRFAGN